ncbi:hypothetical protein PC128_g18124 [Phytophthora cactorum]|nr:hypothetical protein PC120_g14878 [Phytophthora cactorum]KAG3174155.1 hypothetical protein PC128_g18124 [Phytophthora cactorum]KAG4049325.1 hypothetical protein PC123_g15390 [Phytophthora cactorum]
MRSWKVYLIDKPFYLNADHQTIGSLLQQRTCSQRLARWSNELALFQPRFKWVAGSTNIIADSVSRRPDWSDGTSGDISLSELLRQLTTPDSDPDAATLFAQHSSDLVNLHEAFRKGYAKDPIFGPIMRNLISDQATGSRRLRRFTVDDDLV